MAAAMTYNFDPDRWYDNHLLNLEERRAAGDIDDPTYAAQLQKLNEEYDQMLQRLDGTYQLPPS